MEVIRCNSVEHAMRRLFDASQISHHMASYSEHGKNIVVTTLPLLLFHKFDNMSAQMSTTKRFLCIMANIIVISIGFSCKKYALRVIFFSLWLFIPSPFSMILFEDCRSMDWMRRMVIASIFDTIRSCCIRGHTQDLSGALSDRFVGQSRLSVKNSWFTVWRELSSLCPGMLLLHSHNNLQ